MQLSYHFALTKIKKLKNLKKKIYIYIYINIFLYRPVLPEISRYGQYMVGTAGI